MKKFILFALLVLPLAFASCGGDDDEPSYPDKTMVAGDVYSIPNGTTGWTSDNELIASISPDGVKAEHVGETYIRNGSRSFKVTVTGKYNIYQEPYMNFGASMTTVKRFMSNYTLKKETANALLYDGAYPVAYHFFSFKDGGLYLSSVVIKATSVSTDDLIAFMQERYIYVTADKEKYYFGFISPDAQYLVILQLDTLDSQVVYEIIYGKNNTSSSAPAQIARMMKEKKGPTATAVNDNVKAEYSRLSSVMPAANGGQQYRK